MIELIKYQTTEENQICEKSTEVGLKFSSYEEMEQYRRSLEKSSNHKVLLTYKDISDIKTD
jgi:hypothetical protein